MALASSVISGAKGTGTFSSASDAMGNVGSMMKSPAQGKAEKMKVDGKSIDLTGPDGIDEFAVKQAYPGEHGDYIWDTLSEVQEVSDGFTHCGTFMEEQLLAATRDFIRNSGIQQAGRELSKALGQYDDALECAAGFATLFESEGVMDDATGAGDLPQLNKRTRSVVEDVTNASSVSNILSNCEEIRGLVTDFDNMCGTIMNAVNDLIGKDLAALANVLNHLAAWAAFAKLATSDPCALVNSNRMLEHVTAPVMQDIVKLYDYATGFFDEPEEPEVPLGEELVKPPGTIVDVPKHKQDPQAGQASPDEVLAELPVGAGVIAANNEASPKGGYDTTADVWVVDPATGDGEWVSADDPDFPEYDHHGNPIEKKSDFSKGLFDGQTPIDARNERVAINIAAVEHAAVAEDKNKVAKVHKVTYCVGGSMGGMDDFKPGCDDVGGRWVEVEVTDNEAQVAGSVEAATKTKVPPKTIEKDFPVGEPLEPSSESSAGKPRPSAPPKEKDSRTPYPPEVISSRNNSSDFFARTVERRGGRGPAGGTTGIVATKSRSPVEETGSYYGTWGYSSPTTPYNAALEDPILSKQGYAPSASSADPFDPKPFDVATVQASSGLGILPGTYRINPGSAALPSNTSTQKSNIGGDVSEYDMSREVVERAMKTGDWSHVETCACQPMPAVADAKEVGTCDFTDLKFPNGYQMIPQSNYTDNLIAKVDAAEAAGTGEYIVGDDGNIYQSVEVVIMAKYGATVVDPFAPGKEICQKHSGRWYVITAAIKGVSGGSQKADIKNAKSKAVCEDANGEWICKQGQAGSTGGNKAIESYGKFTNKKNVNTKSKLPTTPAFNTDKLPSLNVSAIK